MTDLQQLFTLFTQLDYFAVAFILVAWAGIGWMIENPPASRPSVSRLMARYRREWMQVMVTRQPRIFDAQALGTLRQGTSFFASATMIAIGGALALIGNAEELQGIAQDLSLGRDPRIVWEIKMFLALFFLTNAFLKFVWSHRLFGYCLVLMASVPNEPDDPLALPRADQAADINITAVRGFNRGLRSVYFALGATAWMLGAVPLVIATAITVGVLWRREFASQSRAVLMRDVQGSDTAM